MTLEERRKDETGQVNLEEIEQFLETCITKKTEEMSSSKGIGLFLLCSVKLTQPDSRALTRNRQSPLAKAGSENLFIVLQYKRWS